MDINIVNRRVDQALADNKRAHNLVVVMAAAIFALGMLAFLFAYRQKNPYIAGGSLLINGYLYWPIRQILKLRRDNVVLQTFPVLISTLDPEPAAREIVKLLAYLKSRS